MRALISLSVLILAGTAQADVIRVEYDTERETHPPHFANLEIYRVADGRFFVKSLEQYTVLGFGTCSDRSAEGYYNDATDFEFVFPARWHRWNCSPDLIGSGTATPESLLFEAIASDGRRQGSGYRAPAKVSTYVPEPSGLALLAIGGLIITGRFRRYEP